MRSLPSAGAPRRALGAAWLPRLLLDIGAPLYPFKEVAVGLPRAPLPGGSAEDGYDPAETGKYPMASRPLHRWVHGGDGGTEGGGQEGGPRGARDRQLRGAREGPPAGLRLPPQPGGRGGRHLRW